MRPLTAELCIDRPATGWDIGNDLETDRFMTWTLDEFKRPATYQVASKQYYGVSARARTG